MKRIFAGIFKCPYSTIFVPLSIKILTKIEFYFKLFYKLENMNSELKFVFK